MLWSPYYAIIVHDVNEWLIIVNKIPSCKLSSRSAFKIVFHVLVLIGPAVINEATIKKSQCIKRRVQGPHHIKVAGTYANQLSVMMGK